MDNTVLQNLRTEYVAEELNEKSILTDPILQFEKWFQEAINAGAAEPNAMTLATANVDFKPSARIVLLKGIEEGGFVFFTNYNSRKGKELMWNPYGMLLFFWSELHRQVRIEGRIVKIPDAASDEYFHSRPVASQLSGYISPQSEVIESRKFLEERLALAEKKFSGGQVPRPEHWGGYKLIPNKIEFWQGRPNRLHDRILFTLVNDNEWKIGRLAP
jgi:pyridoxamine 5'-phosphate oxidase